MSLRRHLRFDVALDDSLPQVNRSGGVSGRPLVILAGVDQDVRLTGRAHALILGDVNFLNSALGRVHQRQKTRVVMFRCAHIQLTRSIRAPTRANFSSILS